MDDDAPLSALAKPKAPKIDDDTPLAALVAGKAKQPQQSPKTKGRPSTASKPSAPNSGKPKASPKGGAQPKAKAVGRKRKASSDSDSSGSSGSSSSSSDESGDKKKASKGQKAKLLKRKQSQDDGEGIPVKTKEKTPKEEVVSELLCRWWYVLPDWPPNDDDFYDTELKKHSCRKVSIQEWEWVPEEDEKGRRKSYELSQYRGLFRLSNGTLLDLRPKETCPCYNNMMKKELPELYQLLVTAYENQLKALEQSVYDETKLEETLKTRLTNVRQKAHQVSLMAPTKKARQSN